MIQNIDDQIQERSIAEAAGTHVIAVVALEQSRAVEMERHFAVSGEPVEMVWYRDTQQLRAQAGERKEHFEAVILFSDESKKSGEAEVEGLRRWLGGTPLIEAA